MPKFWIELLVCLLLYKNVSDVSGGCGISLGGKSRNAYFCDSTTLQTVNNYLDDKIKVSL